MAHTRRHYENREFAAEQGVGSYENMAEDTENRVYSRNRYTATLRLVRDLRQRVFATDTPDDALRCELTAAIDDLDRVTDIYEQMGGITSLSSWYFYTTQPWEAPWQRYATNCAVRRDLYPTNRS